MFVIGITGGIGSGKSLVTEILSSEFGAGIINTDQIAHEFLHKDQEIYQNILSCFGRDILRIDGEIDRAKLGSMVFQDEKKLKTLNGILHPLVEEEVDRRLFRFRKRKLEFVCIETALLKDVGYETKCNEVWYVFAEEKIRIKRLMEVRSLSEEKVRQIIARQRTEQAYREGVNRVIDNSFGRKETESQIKDIISLIRGGK